MSNENVKKKKKKRIYTIMNYENEELIIQVSWILNTMKHYPDRTSLFSSHNKKESLAWVYLRSKVLL